MNCVDGGSERAGRKEGGRETEIINSLFSARVGGVSIPVHGRPDFYNSHDTIQPLLLLLQPGIQTELLGQPYSEGQKKKGNNGGQRILLDL